ncbi:MAG: hypothetical protein BWY43_00667 [candidate division WS2 bacterium ADurb.Bin280]|uniref:Uncharacterized protein n=1 Tax=candidate division WS2 bacterium ADurb.Bin280 TaxID=1852829 RepID=A0A1V5SC13_9BACT|nr:MAG: hypothetical protein BWY43_00667 [candidate division WS2 bacterium ADurb.Bin280]
MLGGFDSVAASVFSDKITHKTSRGYLYKIFYLSGVFGTIWLWIKKKQEEE